jgi:copper(I)-binding protein
MKKAWKMRLFAGLAAVVSLGLAPFAAAQVKAVEGWARATPPGARVAAAYLTLVNPGAEERKLLKIVSTVSDQVMLHRTSMTAEGTTRMWPLAGLTLQPGETLRMDAGGVHVMFNDLKTPLVAGQQIPLTLKFEGEPEFTIMLEVRPLVPEAPAQDHSHHHH